MKHSVKMQEKRIVRKTRYSFNEVEPFTPAWAYKNAQRFGPKKEYYDIICDESFPKSDVAFKYANFVAQKPCDKTRKLSCWAVGLAGRYAIEVDKGFHIDTYLVCRQNKTSWLWYQKEIMHHFWLHDMLIS